MSEKNKVMQYKNKNEIQKTCFYGVDMHVM